MPVLQITIDTKERDAIAKIKDKHGHTWLECLRNYARIYGELDPKAGELLDKLRKEAKK